MAQREASARMTHAEQIIIERQLDDEDTAPPGMSLCVNCDEFVLDEDGYHVGRRFYCFSCQDAEDQEADEYQDACSICHGDHCSC